MPGLGIGETQMGDLPRQPNRLAFEADVSTGSFDNPTSIKV